MKSLLFLSLVANYALAHKYALATPGGLKLKPPFLTMLDDAQFGGHIGCSLKTKPAGKVTVFFEAPHFSSSKCRLEFTAKNWNKEQLIRVARLPYLTPADAKRVTEGSFLTVAPGEKFHLKRQKFQIIRTGSPGATCVAWGDPHYVTFAGRAFDFQGSGPYYLIKTPLLTIQQFNLPFNGAPPNIQKRIAIRYHKTVYVFEADNGRFSLASDANEHIEVHTVPGVTWRIQLSDGSIVNVVRHTYSPCNYVDVNIVIGTLYKSRINGLCGLFELPANGGFVASNGAVVGDPNSFGHSWRVPDNDNLFVLGDKAACVAAPEDPQGGTGGIEVCALPKPDELEVDGQVDFDKGEEIVKTVDRLDLNKERTTLQNELAKPIVPGKAPADKWAQEARQKCVSLLSIKECNDILDPKIYVDDCVDDCVLSGTYDYIDDARERYVSAVRRISNSVLDEPAVRDGVNRVAEDLKKKAKAAAKKVGLNDAECPGGCSEQGTCTPDGCECNEGFSGNDCSEENPENPGKAKAFTNKGAPKDIAVQDAPHPRIAGDLKQAEKLEAANMAKKLKDLGK